MEEELSTEEKLIDALLFIGEQLEGINEKLLWLAKPYTMRGTGIKIGGMDESKRAMAQGDTHDAPVDLYLEDTASRY